MKKIETIEDFYAGAQPYIKLLNVFTQKHALENSAKADHICYKCNSKESFEAMRAVFEPQSDYVYQVFISGRRIAYIKLQKGIETTLGMIHFLELSDQKPDGSQTRGFDHIEAYPIRGSYEAFIEKLSASEKVVHIERPHHTTDDIDIGDGFLLRCERTALIEKIKDEIMFLNTR
jgi:predicted metalloenzyme YecM